mgnify:CR=1 FL=1
MIEKYYHASSYDNYYSILDKGIKTDRFGEIFLCKKPEEAARFLVVRGIKDIVAFEIELDDSEVKESFDHSETFFKCKAYTLNRDIKADEILDITRWEVGS